MNEEFLILLACSLFLNVSLPPPNGISNYSHNNKIVNKLKLNLSKRTKCQDFVFDGQYIRPTLERMKSSLGKATQNI